MHPPDRIRGTQSDDNANAFEQRHCCSFKPGRRPWSASTCLRFGQSGDESPHSRVKVAEGQGRVGAAVLLVRHLTKGGGQQALYRGLGSIGIIATVRSGLLVAPRDAGGLARAIRRVLDDRELAERLGRAGRQRIVEHFANEVAIHQTERLYERLLEERRHGR